LVNRPCKNLVDSRPCTWRRVRDGKWHATLGMFRMAVVEVAAVDRQRRRNMGVGGWLVREERVKI
jgi:hypothetical protein